jgi:hypothetical protein
VTLLVGDALGWDNGTQIGGRFVPMVHVSYDLQEQVPGQLKSEPQGFVVIHSMKRLSQLIGYDWMHF